MNTKALSQKHRRLIKNSVTLWCCMHCTKIGQLITVNKQAPTKKSEKYS